jgi:hypothetical protein
LQRILLIVVILLVIWRIVAAWGKRLVRDGMGADSYSRFSPFERRRRRNWSQRTTTDPEELVACSSCGTYVPTRRALTSGADGHYCSEECRDAARLAADHEKRNA